MTRIDPGMPNLLVQLGYEIFQRSDGQLTVGPHLVVDQETWGQLISGYRCMKCFHVQSEAFPVQCEAEGHAVTEELGVVDWRCQMRIRDDQLRMLTHDFGGFDDYSPRDPYDVIDVEQEDWEPTGSGIVVPRNAS